MKPRMPTNRMIALISGTTTWRTACDQVAPSTAAASSRSGSILSIRAMKSSTTKPRRFHVTTPRTDQMASPGSVSQACANGSRLSARTDSFSGPCHPRR